MSAYSEASKAVFEVFDDTTPLVEGLSIDEAFLDVGGLLRRVGHTDRDRRRGCGATCSSGSVSPITVGVARTKFLAKVASGVAKPDGLLVVPPDGELEFLHPLPVEPALGRRPGDRGASCTTGGSRPSARSRSSARRALVSMLGHGVGPASARARAQSRSATGAGRPAPAIDRLAARARALARSRSDGHRRHRSWRSSIASPAACAPPSASAARSCSGCASTTSRARRGRTRCRARPRTPRTILATARGAAGRGGADDRASGADARSGSRSRNLDDDDVVQLALAVRSGRRRRTRRHASTTSATGSARRAVTRAVLLGRDPGLSVPMLPD